MPSFQRQTLQLLEAHPDRIPQDAPAEALSAIQNVYFVNDEVRRVPGDRVAMLAPSEPPRALRFYTRATGEPYWVVVGETSIEVTDGAVWWDVTPVGGWTTTDAVYTTADFNGLVVINASTRAPVYWNGDPGVPCAELPGWDVNWQCMAMRSHKQFLIAIGMTDVGGMQRVRWSDAAEAGQVPAEWEPAADNLAGWVDLVPTSSPCIDGFTLRDSFYVFKGVTVHALDFVGGNAVFQARKVFENTGIAGANGWAIGQNDMAIYIGSDGDIYRTDGVDYASILDRKAQELFYSELDESLLTKLAGASLTRLNQSWLCYPEAGAENATKALIFDWSTGAFGWRQLPHVWCLAEGRVLEGAATALNTWDSDEAEWNSDQTLWNFEIQTMTRDDLLGGTDGPKLLAMNDGTTWDDGSGVEAFAQKLGLAFGNPQKQKLVSRVWPKLRGSDGDLVKLRIGGQETPDGAVQWTAEVDAPIGDGVRCDAFASGRYLALEFSSSAATRGRWAASTSSFGRQADGSPPGRAAGLRGACGADRGDRQAAEGLERPAVVRGRALPARRARAGRRDRRRRRRAGAARTHRASGTRRAGRASFHGARSCGSCRPRWPDGSHRPCQHRPRPCRPRRASREHRPDRAGRRRHPARRAVCGAGRRSDRHRHHDHPRHRQPDPGDMAGDGHDHLRDGQQRQPDHRHRAAAIRPHRRQRRGVAVPRHQHRPVVGGDHAVGADQPRHRHQLRAAGHDCRRQPGRAQVSGVAAHPHRRREGRMTLDQLRQALQPAGLAELVLEGVTRGTAAHAEWQDGFVVWWYPEPGHCEIIAVGGTLDAADTMLGIVGADMWACGARSLSWTGERAWPRLARRVH